MIGELSALAGALTWALSGVLLTRISRKVHIAAIGFVRCLASALFFFLLVPFSGGLVLFQGIELRYLGYMAAAVVLSLGLADSLFLVSARRIGMVRAMPLCMTFPLFTVVMAAIFLGETISTMVLMGAVLILGGVYHLSSGPRMATAHEQRRPEPLGLLLALVTAILWSASTIFLTPVSQNLHPVALNSIRQSWATMLFLVVMPKPAGRQQLRALSKREFLILLAGALLGTGLGSLLYIWALRYAGAAVTSVLTAATPAFSTPFSILLLGERVDRRILVGTMLIIAGVFLVILS